MYLLNYEKHHLLTVCLLDSLLTQHRMQAFHRLWKSPSVQLTTLIQDSIIRYKPQEAEMLLAKAKQQAQDSTEYYYAEAVHSSLLMTRQQEDSAFYYINRCEKFCLSLPKLLPIHYLTLGIAENNKASLLENSNHPLSAKTAQPAVITAMQTAKTAPKALLFLFINFLLLTASGRLRPHNW